MGILGFFITKINEPISQDPFSPIVEPDLHQISLLFQEKEENSICLGHHYPRHFFKNDHTIFLNPGSLGCNSKPTAPYSIIDIKEERIDIQIEEVAYDNIEFLASYGQLQVLDRDFLLEIFHGNQLKQQLF